jgi:hypothetical protein
VLLQKPAPVLEPHDAARMVAFFNLCYVVIHREYLSPAAVQRIDQFLHDHFRHEWRREESSLIVYALSPPSAAETRWPEDYYIDFGAPPRAFALRDGWSGDEQTGANSTMQWSNAPQSSLFLFLDNVHDRVLEMRLQPLRYNGSPSQVVDVHVNGARAGGLALREDWAVYQMRLPAALFIRGRNTLTFSYRYTARPTDKIPGSADTRALAVAFDYVALRSTR